MTGKKVKELRKANNLTMSKLANICKISQSYISDLENGKIKNPSGIKLGKIAEALGVSTDYLLVEKHRDSMESFANSWNSKSKEERNLISNKVKENWEEEKKETVINTIVNIADASGNIEFFLNDDNTINYEKSKEMFDFFVHTMNFMCNSPKK